MRCIYLLVSLSLISLPASEAQTELPQLFDDIERFETDSRDSLYKGFHPRLAWTSVADTAQRRQADSLRRFAARLSDIDSAQLVKQERISRAVMRIKLQDGIDQVDYRMHLIPFSAEGGFYNSLAYVLPKLPFASPGDYEHYLAWLPHYTSGLRQNLSLMRQGLAEGIVAPEVIVRNTLSLLETWAVETPEASPVYEPFTRMPAGFSESERAALELRAGEVIGELNAAYAELNAFIRAEYLPAAPERPGVGFLPRGMAYYENQVRHYTTLPLTADSVHQLGLREVARIRAAMDSVIAEVGFEGSFAEFLEFLRSDDQFYATSPQELLNRAAWISKQAEGQLPKLFSKLYTLPFTVAPVPASIAPTYTTGRYVGGSWEQHRPGTYWVNTYDLRSRTLYTLPALTLHEAVPGHHLQGALAAEIEGLPKFRQDYYISAFGEGWGLYSEYLGEEMGMYTTPYELFGRYTYEMWRACRLVIDTGIHAGGWSRERALGYLAENTALSLHEVETEIDRYIGWPGQAVSYKVGELQLKGLRRQAEAALGERFELGAFHEVVLRNGSVPLDVLTAEVEAWLAGRPN